MPITERTRRKEIRERFRNHDPLNLSAVERECPWLLEGLFEPENFVGWKAALEAAGVSYDEIVVHAAPGLRCEICGEWAEPTLTPHLRTVHGITADEYRAEFPAAEIVCEASRAANFGLRHGRKAKLAMPHWEPAWNWRYALDRLHTFYKTGRPVNYSAIAKADVGLARYLRRVYGSWDAALAAAGLDPKRERLAAPAQTFSREEIPRALRRLHRESPTRLRISQARLKHLKTLLFAVFSEFGSYEAALDAARLKPSKHIPALEDPAMLKRRRDLLREVRRRLRQPVDYDVDDVRGFRLRAEPVILAFYGNWANLAASLGVLEREIFNSPTFAAYDSKKLVLQGLRERAAAGLTMRAHELRSDNASLLMMAEKHYGQYAKALAAANIELPPPMLDARDYQTPESVVAELRRRREAGLSNYAIDVVLDDRSLHKWAERYFGSYQAALKAARIRQPAFKPRGPSEQTRYPDARSVVAEIQARQTRGESVNLYVVKKARDEGGDITLWHAACKFYKTWQKALRDAGIEASNKPEDGRKTRQRFWSEEDVIAEIRRRREAGLPLRSHALKEARAKGGDITLYKAGRRFFATWDAALRKAGI